MARSPAQPRSVADGVASRPARYQDQAEPGRFGSAHISVELAACVRDFIVRPVSHIVRPALVISHETAQGNSYDKGGICRTHLRGHTNILKRPGSRGWFQSRPCHASDDRPRHAARLAAVLVVALCTRIVELWDGRTPPCPDRLSAFTPDHRFELAPITASKRELFNHGLPTEG